MCKKVTDHCMLFVRGCKTRPGHFMHASFHACVISCMRHFMHASFHACVISCMHHFMHASFHACVISRMCHFTHVSFHACVVSCMCGFMHVWFHACVVSCMCEQLRGGQTWEACWSVNLMVFMAAAESQVSCSATAAANSRFPE